MEIEKVEMFRVGNKAFGTEDEAKAEIDRSFVNNLIEIVYQQVSDDGIVRGEEAVLLILTELRNMNGLSKKKLERLIKIMEGM